MPNYAKAMKEFLCKNRRFGEFETIALTTECSLFFQNKLPPNLKDLGSFIIPCNIGESYYGKALCDLGSSINLMLTSVFKQLGIGRAKLTTITLQLVDQSLEYPEGKIDDVLVRVDKFINPADFILLGFEVDKVVPIILGRPFLETGRMRVVVQKGKLTMQVQDEQVTFNVLKALRSPNEVKDCVTVSMEDLLIPNDLLKGCITTHDLERLVENIHELNPLELSEPIEPEIDKSLNKSETEANSIIEVEEVESEEEPNDLKPIKKLKVFKPGKETNADELVEPSVGPELTIPIPTSSNTKEYENVSEDETSKEEDEEDESNK
ncbi:uncharacterized protein LOC105781400 [Gossypium raimondii]|uniref:uncharacterized protein LOC105781400 n=1 Tax=Gossypium raimondii TaxID=29730 RepID=UPI00063A8A4E|nr:uncharacterized protein LOC105781400 [Gossypium raimondii]